MNEELSIEERNEILTDSLKERDREISKLLAMQNTLASLLQSALPAGQKVTLSSSCVTIERVETETPS